MYQPRILMVVDDKTIEASLRTILTPKYFLIVTQKPQDALDILFQEMIDVVILNIDIPGTIGLKLLEVLRSYNLAPEVVMLTSTQNKMLIIDAVKLGVFNFVPFPFEKDDFGILISNLLEKRFLKIENKELMKKIDAQLCLGSFVGKGDFYNLVVSKINSFSKTDNPILIVGEKGTEKDLIAYEIYKNSDRIQGPYIKKMLLDDSALDDISFVYSASNGYLVLEDIGELNLEMQRKLKGLLVGIPVNVRLILLSSRSLRQEVAAGKFAEELYQLVYKNDIFILPLRERLQDLPHIIRSNIKIFNELYNFSIEGMSDETMIELSKYNWPGNMTELRAVLYLMANYKKLGRLEITDIPLSIRENKEGLEERFKEYYAKVSQYPQP